MRKLIDKYVIIEWIDSTGFKGIWQDDEVVLKLDLDNITSIGRVIQEDEDFITLVAHVASNQLAGVMCIPRSSIKKTKVLFHYKKVFNKK